MTGLHPHLQPSCKPIGSRICDVFAVVKSFATRFVMDLQLQNDVGNNSSCQNLKPKCNRISGCKNSNLGHCGHTQN